MADIKWYKRDPDAALTGMLMLSLEERGAYNTILDLIYSTGDKLIDDDRFICGWLRCDLRVWKRIKNKLVETGKIALENGRITNFRATKTVLDARNFQTSLSDANRIKGIKSGAVRKKIKYLAEPRVEPKFNRERTYLESESELELEEKKEKPKGFSKEKTPAPPDQIKAISKPQNGTRLPEEWFPEPADCDAGYERGLVEEEIRYEHKKFTDHWLGTPGQKGRKIDWNATFRNWLRRAADDKRNRQVQGFGFAGEKPKQRAFERRH